MNKLHNMLKRNLSRPFELVCATNNAAGLDDEIRPAPLEEFLVKYGNAFPKLAAFRPDADTFFGKRLLVLDLDTVIVGSLDSLVNTDRDFTIWRDVLAAGNPRRFRYNSSMILMDAGARSYVWDDFKPDSAKRKILSDGRCGSDQAWISCVLGDERTFTAGDGVLSWRFNVSGKPLPPNAKIIFYHGREKPWHIPDDPIVKAHYH